MRKLLVILFSLLIALQVKSQIPKPSGFYSESNCILLNNEPGNEYTLNNGPFMRTLRLRFVADSNVVYEGELPSIRKYYTVSNDLLTIKFPLKRKAQVDTIYNYYKMEPNGDAIVLNDYKENMDETFFLKKHFMSRNYVFPSKLPVAPAEIFTIVEQSPAFPGGAQAMQNFISKKIHYPKEIEDGKPVEKVFVKLLIDTAGKIVDAEILNTPRNEFVKEAMKVIRQFPAFSPGKQNGKAVFVFYNLPITFKRE